ncbi:MAG: DUF4034 domain-containing protein [Pseudomonadota bacterium]
MLKRAITLVLIALAAGAWIPARAGELEDRTEIARRVSALFEAERFDELDRMAEEFRTQETRSSSGLWMLTLMYRGLYLQHEGKVDESYYDKVDGLYLKWAEQNPDSTVARIGYASSLANRAWFFRGSGWGRDVPKEAWERFFEYLAKARLQLMEHKQTTDKDPVWFHDMVVIAKGENWPLDRFLALVEEATGKHPYFYEIYFRSIDYLLPKWHGDKEMIEEFANLAVEETREREGIGMYARIYWHASQVQFGTSLFTGTKVVWNRMSAGIDDVLARYPDQWNINNFAHFACVARDKEKTAALLARIDGPPIETAWANDLINYRLCKLWVEG